MTQRNGTSRITDDITAVGLCSYNKQNIFVDTDIFIIVILGVIRP